MSAHARLSTRLALIGIITAVAVLLSAPLAWGANESISGTVTDPLGDPIAGACVTAEGESGEFPAGTDASGDYTIAVAPGDYILRFDDCGAATLATEYYNDKFERELAETVTVAEDEPKTGYNAVLEPAPDDDGPPNTEITAGPPTVTTESVADFTFEANQPNVSFECSLDGVAFTACESPKHYDALADGDHHFEVRAVDALGRPDPSPDTADFHVDSAAPETTITGGPSFETISTRTPTFTFESDDPDARFTCQIDDRSYPCSSPDTVEPLENGPHTYAVWARDENNNTDQTRATVSFYVNVEGPVDRDPPETTITEGPPGVISSTSTAFVFESDEPHSGFECKLDSANYAPCSSPRVLTGLDDGPHTFTVRARDAAGNRDESPASRTFTVDQSADTTPPETAITSKPTGTIGQTYATFGFTSSEPGSTFECRMDGGTFTACSSPRTYANLGDGSHTFEVRAVDSSPLKNTDPSPASATFTVQSGLGTDTTPPETTIDSGPVGDHNQRSATFEFHANEDVSRFDCRLGTSGPWTSCTSPKTYSGLSDDTYTFQVRAVDAAGNFDTSPATSPFTVDATPPDTLLAEGPDGQRINTTSTSFTFGASESGVTYECRLDLEDEWTECDNPHQLDGLGEGTHTLAFRAVDSFGNADGTPIHSGFTVDLTDPDTIIDSGPSGTVTAVTPFSFHATEDAFFDCRIDGGDWENCNSPHDPGPLGPGAHTFEVRATDQAGNVDGSPASRSFTIGGGGGAPETFIDGGPSGTIATASATFTFSSDKGGASFQCQLDGSGFSPCSSPQTYSGMGEGSHTFAVRAVSGGTPDASPATRTFVVDLPTTQPPPTGPGPECAAATNKLKSAQGALKKAKKKVKKAKGKAKKKAKKKLKKAKANVKKAQAAVAASC